MTGSLDGSERALRRALLVAAFALAAIGLAGDLAYFAGSLPGETAAFFSLTAEGNLPTWYASVLLSWCGLALGSIAWSVLQVRGRHLTAWVALAVAFLYMSLDEAVEIHERLGGLVEGRGILYFSWVVPASVVVLVGGLSCLPLLWSLPSSTRRRFVVAGAIYVGGALVLELPIGWWTERHGDDNVVYTLLDLVEETMELVGASLFLVALRAHRRTLEAPS